ncbi:PorT family protein [Flavobacterium sp. J49]|uniref:porin family protein n=1 Tax=Flavobacterium sp. J49 TaxID=2718534 RepID=UPI00159398BC|nr:porin family protein [Flavobacterium sp. J49]MBF6640906.1 PorT family protein [Flavobacterium sp. J49]NIC02153.1 PorT family protein [Flavobacterium sp. J49]
MKKITLFAAVFTCCISFGQNKLGAFTGLNYSYFTDTPGGQVLAEESFGLQLGIVYEKEIAPKVHFRPKLMFSQQGDRTKTPATINFDPMVIGNGFEMDQIDKKLTYINIPLEFKFWNKIYLLAGPQLGFLINEKAMSSFSQDAKSDIDFGFNLGTGFTVNKLFFEVGIYQGLTTIYSYNYYATGSSVKANNGYARFTVGYLFK